jgi:flagellar biosynthesis protein FlhG
MPSPTIIPVGGGKGGVGKSFLAANLAIALAQRGARVIAVDVDLGNSNLHDLLGLSNDNPGLGEYLTAGARGPLDRFLVPTSIPTLRFIPGDARMPFMANITYNQKRRLLAEIPKLDAQYIFLDLSAGTSFNTLDFCLLANSALLVTTPAHSSIMSLLVFIKNLLLRAINRSIGRKPELLDLLRQAYVQPVDQPVATISRLIADLDTRNRTAAAEVRGLCRRLRPRLVYNMCDEPGDLSVTPSIDRTLREILGMECEHIGALFFDPGIHHAAKRPRLYLTASPDSESAHALHRIAVRIERFWRQTIPNSGSMLRQRTEEVFQREGPLSRGIG